MRRFMTVTSLVVTILLVGSCAASAPAMDDSEEIVDAARSRRNLQTATTLTPTTLAPTTTAVPAPTTTVPVAPVAPAPSAPVTSPAGFQHPGVVLDVNHLRSVRDRIAAGQQPWADSFARLQSSGRSIATERRPTSYRFSSLDYQASPVPSVQCFAGTGRKYAEAHPELGLKEIGCKEQLDDATAAYTLALMWYFTGDARYAEKSIEVMDAWSGTLTQILFDQPRTDLNQQIYANGKLQAGWSAQLLTRAAELIRYTYGGWSPERIARFSAMLRNVHQPLVITGWTSGANWLMTFAEATIGIGVFNDDRATFDAGVAMWRAKVPTTIYMPGDGALPVAPHKMFDTEAKVRSYWYNPSSFVPGLQGETLRDLSHMTMGLGAMSNAAETARLQGVDLWGEQRQRIVTAFELNAGYVNQYLDEVQRLGGNQPASTWRPSGWVGSSFTVGGVAYRQGWEVAYAQYGVREGLSMPNTRRVVERLRPSGIALHMTWETLTHAR